MTALGVLAEKRDGVEEGVAPKDVLPNRDEDEDEAGAN